MSMFRKIFKPSEADDKGSDREDIRNLEYKRKIDPSFRDPCGKGHLHILLEHGYDNPDDLDYVLSCGCEVNIQDNENNYPIHIAVTRGLNKCVKKLIQRNSLLDVFNNQDMTPLMKAAKLGHADNLFNLLQNGANPNLSNKAKYSAMHYVCVGGDVRCLKLLLEARGKVNYQDEKGYTPLIHAAKNGHYDVVKCLLEHKVFPKLNPNKQDNEKRTALHWAVDGGFMDVTKMLMEHGVDADLANSCGDTAFGRALKCNQPQALRVLIAHGCDRGSLDGLSGTCLGLAALLGYDECLELLLQSGEHPDEVAYFGKTPLMAAAYESKLKCVELLLKYGAHPDVRGRNGGLAVPMSFINLSPGNEKDRHNIVKLLLRAGANPNIRLQPTGPSVLPIFNITGGRTDMVSIAMLSGYVSMVTMLLVAGARVTKEEIETLSSNSFLSYGFLVSPVMIEKLKTCIYQPLSLKQVTRKCVRNAIGVQASKKIDQLSIAKPLKRYLNLDELDHVPIERCYNKQLTLGASTSVQISPCGLSNMAGSLMHENSAPTLGICNCDYCKKYEETLAA